MAKMNKGGYITSPLLTVAADRPIHVGLKSEPREVFEVKVVVSRNTPCLFTYEIDEEGKLECPSELLDYQAAEAKRDDRALDVLIARKQLGQISDTPHRFDRGNSIESDSLFAIGK